MTQLDSQDYTIEDEEMLTQKATKKSSENKDIFAGHAERKLIPRLINMTLCIMNFTEI